MHDSPPLALILDEQMQKAGYGASRLANRVNQLFERPHFLHRNTVTNWMTGHVKTVRDWRKLVAIAAVLGLEEMQTNMLLQAAQLPSLRELWSCADQADLAFLTQIPASNAPLLPVLYLDSVPESGQLPPGSRVPINHSSLFVGRQAALQRIAHACERGKFTSGKQTVVITGMGGVGKTQLAAEFAHRYGRFFSGGVFWLHFDQHEDIPTQVAQYGNQHHLNLHPEFEELPLAERVMLVQRAWEQDVPRLLIFDECEDDRLLAQWQPKTGGGYLLVTSRRGRWDPALGATQLTLDVLNREESIRLLSQFKPTLSTEEANAIAIALGDMPLALHLAGSFLAHYQFGVSPSDYLHQLKTLQGQALLDHPSLQGAWIHYAPTAHEMHIARTFALTYEKLNLDDPVDRQAHALLIRAACFAPAEPIPRTLLKATLSTDEGTCGTEDAFLQAEDALLRLITLGLAQEQENGMIQLHRLLVEFVRGVTSDISAQMAVEDTIIFETARANQIHAYASLRDWQGHLRYMTTAALKRGDEQAARLSRELGGYLFNAADYDGAYIYLQHALHLCQQHYPSGHLETADCCHRLGCLLRRQGKYEVAEKYLQETLRICQQLLGPEDAPVENTLGQIGGVLFYRRLFGSERKLIVLALDQLGTVFHEQGKYEEGRQYLEQVLDLQEKQFGPDHLQTAISLSNLSSMLIDQGEYEIGRRYLERALVIGQRELGDDNLLAAFQLSILGTLHDGMGRYEQARQYLDKAHAIRENKLGQEHPVTMQIVEKIGLVLCHQGKYEEALTYFERALAVYRERLGQEHPQVAKSLNDMGGVYKAQGRYELAQSYLEQALILRQKVLGHSHPDTAETRHQLDYLHLA